MKNIPYSYVVMRYVHDTRSAEFVNVGVVVYAPEAHFVKGEFRQNYSRLSHMFPSFDSGHFKKMMVALNKRFNQLHEETIKPLDFGGHAEDALGLARRVIPSDDNSYQWSQTGKGLSANLEQTLKQLFDRFVTRYDIKKEDDRHNEDKIWRIFRHSFEEKRILSRLESKTIQSAADEIEFPHALKNGIWHCMEAVSFDLQHSKNIKQKARTWLGTMTGLKDANERFKMYFLVGSPQQGHNQKAYDQALSLLDASPIEHEIIFEDKADVFATRVSSMLQEHDESSLLENA